jgi:hypothetical protein
MSRSANHFFAGASGSTPNYIEDVFSTYLYTGNGTSQTITNGIDLSTKGGLLWMKSRSEAAGHVLYDTASNATLRSDSTSANSGYYPTYINPTSSGFFLDASAGGGFNTNAVTYASWTFRKQAKFFDCGTYTGSGSSQTISHNLGSAPGCIMIKKLDSNTFNAGWAVYHRSLSNPNNYYLVLNTDAAQANYGGSYISNVTSTSFNVAGDAGQISIAGSSYVYYAFAHNAGGFGLSGTDNVISCGSYTGNGSTTGPVIELGYEPQWLLIKNATGPDPERWHMFDNMRGMPVGGQPVYLYPNETSAEGTSGTFFSISATGFQLRSASNATNSSGQTFIYVAIRRGPMKVPTVGTSVYNNLANRVGTSATATISGVGFPVDLMLPFATNVGSVKPFVDRLRGATKYLLPPYSNAEQTETNVVTSFASNDGVIVGADSLDVINNYYNADRRYAASFFRRAPSFFDEVCYTGTEVSGQTFNHNLGAVPEFMIVKSRSGTTDWTAYHSALGASARIYPNATNAVNTGTAAPWNSTAPTSSVFSLGNAAATNLSGETFVNYLFATCPGVSKVGSYTGTGALQTINCGFTSGARFILIKRTDSTGDWYMYDSARGISASSDPYLLLNTTGASELGTNYVDTDTTGFKVTAAAPAALNANGGSFIFLAIA